MTTRTPIIRLARLLASAPTVTYREHEVLRRIRMEIDRIGLASASDRWGNLYAVYRGARARGRPVAITAHTDHPGLVVSASSGRRAEARWLGGVQARYFRGGRVRVETPEGPVRGRIEGVEQNEAGRVVRVALRLDREVPAGSVGGWDLVPFEMRGEIIRTKSADDLMGCAAILHLLRELVRRRPALEVWGVFTRAEEEGLYGAAAMADAGILPPATAVVVLETSRVLPCGKQGAGPILRVGDRLSVYDPGVSLAIREACELLAKGDSGFRWQRCLMDGGVCEATAFQAFGYPAGGLALALGNYHNMGARRVEEETIHAADLIHLGQLLPVAAEKIAIQRDPLAQVRANFRRKLMSVRKTLVATRDLPAPPRPPGPRGVPHLKVLAWLAAGLLGAAATAGSTPWLAPDDGAPFAKPGAPAALTRERIPSPPSEADPMDGYDALHYAIRVRIDPSGGAIEGTVGMEVEAIDDLTQLEVHLGPTLTPQTVTCAGVSCTFERIETDRLRIVLPAEVRTGETTLVQVAYSGTPGPAYFSGFQFYSRHGEEGASFPMVSTLSQPDRARTWWPCKDRMSDKARVRITVDAPGGFVVAANGARLQEEVAGDRVLTTWETQYPTATYLVAFAATDYATWTESYLAEDGGVMPLAFYAYPEDSAAARIDFHTTHEALDRFEALFGPYPFRNPAIGVEKLGVAEFAWSTGAMEHQTLVSYGERFVTGTNSNDPILVHEIAHQWFGDAVTPNSMDDIWLNEGFATYCEALFAEGRGGAAGYRRWMARIRNPVDFEYRGTVVQPEEWFGSTTYRKGAWVLHMLRGILGDERFFAALRAYYERHLYGGVTTAEFIRAIEEESGEDLRWFFVPWLYGTGRPVLAFDWDAEGDAPDVRVRLLLRQTQEPIAYPSGSPMERPPEAYAFPLTVRLYGRDAGGFPDSLDRVVFIPGRTEVVSMEALPFVPESIALDPDAWLLREIEPGRYDALRTRIVGHPNPSSGPVEWFVRAAGGGPTEFAIFDLAGRRVRRMGTVAGSGYHRIFWNGRNDDGSPVAAGVYWLRAEGPAGDRAGRIVITR